MFVVVNLFIYFHIYLWPAFHNDYIQLNASEKKNASEDDIERFFSSEDEVLQEGIRCMKGPFSQDSKSADRWSSGRDNTTQKSLGIKSRNSGSDKTQSRVEENTGTLDNI